MEGFGCGAFALDLFHEVLDVLSEGFLVGLIVLELLSARFVEFRLFLELRFQPGDFLYSKNSHYEMGKGVR